MSTTVDNRVVEMRFDNRHFEENVQTSMSTLDKLKHSLNLTGATKGLENVDKAAGQVDMSILGGAVDTVRMRFSAMEVMAVTALANITNSAVNTGKRMISALTVDPIKTGFQEYETQINSVQTILANTESKGSTLNDVNKALDTLNQYADKTIYNFTEMTRNIGTFTAAGIDLNTSVQSIQGIANLAAVSGSTSQQASTAMYQLSQALSSGTVKLMDWNSVVNAGMGGAVFQDALKATSRQMVENAKNLQKMSEAERKAYQESHGYTDDQMKNVMSYSHNVDEIIKKNGSFRESLQEGWITAEVLTTTLNKMTKEGVIDYITDMTGASKDSVVELQKLGDTYGFDSEQVKELAKSIAKGDEALAQSVVDTVKMASTAENAATKVKTFSQLWDTLKEAAQSGWTQTWEIIVGDFEEAKEMLTNISDVVGNFINQTSEARNNLLQGWKDAGGRTDLLDSFANTFKFLGTVVKPVTEAFKEVFPALKVEQLTTITDNLKKFTENLKLSEEASENIKSTFKGVFSIFEIIAKAVGVVGVAVWELLNSEGIGKLASFLLDITGAIGDFFTKIGEGVNTKSVTGVLSAVIGGVSDIFGTAVTSIETFGDLITAVGDVIVNVAKKIWSGGKTVFDWISENFSTGDIFAGLAGGGIFMAAKNIAKVFKEFDFVEIIKGVFGMGDSDKDNGPKLMDQIKDVLGSVGDSLNAFTTSVKISSLVSIAVAVGILSASLRTISEIDAIDVVKSLGSIGVMMTMLCKALEAVSDTVSFYGSGDLIKAGAMLILMATSINILANAMEKFAKLSLTEIVKGLIGVAGGLTALSMALKIIGETRIPISTSIAIVVVAESCKILADALVVFGSMAWDQIAKGLTAMGGALAEMIITLGVLSKVGGFGSVLGGTGLLIAVQALDDMAEGLQKFGDMTWDQIERGFTAMGIALGEMVISLGALSKIAGFSSIFASGAILMVTQGLDEIADALQQIGSMKWEDIAKGVTGMGIALAEVAGISGALGVFAGFAGIVGSAAILIAVQSLDEIAAALKEIGSMTWDQIERGFTAMGIALGELVISVAALGTFAGFSGILGSGAILIAVQSLDEIAAALKDIGSLTWDEIGRGLVGMGGALAEVAVITGVLGSVAGLPAILGGGAILLAVQGLGELADALVKLGSMSWEQVGIGLSAMSGALGSVALGSLLNTFSGFGAAAISEVAAPLGVLADSVKKWMGVTVPEGLGTQLGALANGVEKFTFSGWGGSALAEVAAPVGTLADSISKWSGVTIPDGLGDKMGALADGVKKFTFDGMGASALGEAAPAIGQLADSIKKWSGVTIPEGLSDKMGPLADAVERFSLAGLGASALASAAPAVGQLADSIKKWVGLKIPEGIGDKLKSIANGIKKFSGTSGISSAAKALESFVGSLSDAINSVNDSKGDFETAGSDISSSFVDGIEANAPDIIETIKTALSDAVDTAKDYYDDFVEAGKDAATGFADGIDKNTFKAKAKAKAMAEAALEAAKKALDENSPSKEFYKIGDFAGMGFVNALDNYESVAAKSGYNMADAAKNGLATAARKVEDILNNETGLTIRPVLDLSEVQSGANSISNMLRLGTSVGVTTHVGSINSMMHQNGQNGTNGDVVGAINKLRREVGNMNNVTYVIDGITYDDGSNVANAIQELTRAAIRERRA